MSMWRTKKNKDGSLEWESFPPIDVDSFVNNQDPKKRAHNFATSDVSLSDKSQLTTDESEMLSSVNDHIEQLKEWHRRAVGEIKKEIKDRHNNPSYYLRKLGDKFRKEARRAKDTFVSQQENNYKSRLNAYKNLNSFRIKNDIDSNKPATYPESKLYHFALVLVAIVIEAVANSFFFAQGSEIGLIGGWISALLISIANVAFSMFAGVFFLRYVNHVSKVKKLGGIIFFTISLCLLAILHLATAHYREILTRNPDAEIISALAPLWNNPFALQDMESLLLMAIGIVISALGIWKGYTYDDPYPGFGKIYRIWEENDNEMLESKHMLKQQIGDFYDEAVEQSNNVEVQLSDNQKELEKFKGEVTTYLGCVEGYHAQALNCAKRLINIYRNIVQQIYGDENKFPYTDGLVSKGVTDINIEGTKRELLDILEEKIHDIESFIASYPQMRKGFVKELEKERIRVASENSIEEMLKVVAEQRRNAETAMD